MRELFLMVLPVTASVLLLIASTLGGPFPLLAFFCLTPLALAVTGSSTERALFSGFAFGFSIWVLSAWWIFHALRTWMEFGIITSLLVSGVFFLWQAFPYLIYGFISARINWNPDSLISCIGGAALLTLILSLFPHIFPGHPAHPLHRLPVLIQVADLGGTDFLLFLVCLINFLAAGIVMSLKVGRSVMPGIATMVLIFVFMGGYGHYRIYEMEQKMRSSPDDRWVTVATVSPNRPPGTLDDTVDYFQRALLQSYAVAERHPAAEVILWPEVALNISLQPGDDTFEHLSGLAKETGKPVVFNARRPIVNGGEWGYNTVAFMDTSGTVTHLYLKRILMPFSEYIPFENQFPFLRTLFANAGHTRSGSDHLILPVRDSVALIPSVCYESLSPNVIASGIDMGGSVIINMSNNGHFLSKQAARWHLVLTQFRSVEFRLPLVMVTNNGYGAMYQADGRMVPETLTPFREPSESMGRLFIPQEKSLYFKAGLAGRICFYLLLVLMVCAMIFPFGSNDRRLGRSPSANRCND